MTRVSHSIRGALVAALLALPTLPGAAVAQGSDPCLVGTWTSTNLVDYMNSVGGANRAPIMPNSSDLPAGMSGEAIPTSPTFVVSEITGNLVVQFMPTEARPLGQMGMFSQVTGPGGLSIIVISRGNMVMRTDYNVRLGSDYAVEAGNVLTFTNPMMQFGEATISMDGLDLGTIPLDGMAEDANTLFGPTSMSYECSGNTLKLAPILRGMTLTPQVYQRNP